MKDPASPPSPTQTLTRSARSGHVLELGHSEPLAVASHAAIACHSPYSESVAIIQAMSRSRMYCSSTQGSSLRLPRARPRPPPVHTPPVTGSARGGTVAVAPSRNHRFQMAGCHTGGSRPTTEQEPRTRVLANTVGRSIASALAP
jgi:hypothetical protein